MYVPVLRTKCSRRKEEIFLTQNLVVEDIVMKSSATTKANVKTMIRALVFCALAVFVSAVQARTPFMPPDLVEQLQQKYPDGDASYFYYEAAVDGSVVMEQEPRTADDGTLYITYDAATKRMYLSHTGFGSANAYVWQAPDPT
jgi:hypothetical protein